MIACLIIIYGAISLVVAIWTIMMISSYIHFITVNASFTHSQFSNRNNKIKKDQFRLKYDKGRMVSQ
ncbi:MAG TPA: hypothetical protein VKY57_16710 [Chitinispirillaceae bacterium]|nr:hypothetical protein [Chitinispirillaceae bacterium]